MSSAPRRGLGRGLEVLIGGAGSEAGLAQIAIDKIHPNPKQPRQRFDQEATSGLADSIRAQGIVQPVLVRPRKGGGYELIAGERRWRAAQEAAERELRVQTGAHEVHGVHELRQTLERVVLGLDGDEHTIGGGERVHRQRPQ